MLICGNLFVVTPIFLSQKVGAEDMSPYCDSGHIEGTGLSSTFTIVLYCKNLKQFTSSGTVYADSADLVNIVLHPLTDPRNPLSATINGDVIELVFYSSYGSENRDVYVNQNLVTSDLGLTNDSLTVTTDSIADYNLPYTFDDYYEIIGSQLDVSAENGVSKNDIDLEGLIVDCALNTYPSHGTLDLKSDGSFTYIRDDGYYGDDQFSYFAVDANGNSSSTEDIVYISDVPPRIINPVIQKKGSGDATRARVGDSLRVSLETSEKATLSDMVIRWKPGL